ncbi:hypothetical protein MPSEU_000418800 [Mayamaea pseudoterrestris]|nr:hypothetical protein MPSEU_000418800 [Mayamaea pseudoterrestris]
MSSPFRSERLQQSPSQRFVALASTTSRRLQQSIQQRRPNNDINPPSPTVLDKEPFDVYSLLRSLYQLNQDEMSCHQVEERAHGHHDPAGIANNPLSSPSSYLPIHQTDWMLDGRDEWKHDYLESLRLQNELQKSSSLLHSLLEQENPSIDDLQVMEILIDNDESDDSSSCDGSSCDENGSMDNEADFGDFQSAFQADLEKEGSVHVSKNLTQAMELQLATTLTGTEEYQVIHQLPRHDIFPESELSTSTNGLLDRVDALLHKSADWNGSPSRPFSSMKQTPNSPDTFRLMEQTELVLQTAKRSKTCFRTSNECSNSPSEEKKQDDAPLDFSISQTSQRQPNTAGLDDDFVHGHATIHAAAPIDIDSIESASVTSNGAINDGSDGVPNTRPMTEIQFLKPTCGKPPLHLTTPTPSITHNILHTTDSSCNYSPTVDPHRQMHISETEESIPLSLQLPMQDMSTAAGRFIRRQQLALQQEESALENDNESGDVAKSLTAIDQFDIPLYFFQPPNSESQARLLGTLPWHFLHEHMGEQGFATWDEYMVEKLSVFDSALEQVHAHILNDIGPHETDVRHANELVHDLEQNLQLSLMYSERSRRAIELAWGDGVSGAGLMVHAALLPWWEERSRAQELDVLLLRVSDILKKEQELLQRIDTFNVHETHAMDEYLAVMSSASEVQSLLCQESLVAKFCRTGIFDWDEYARLLQIAINLHASTFTDAHKAHLAEKWSQCIIRALCNESDRALATALLEPSGAQPTQFTDELARLRHEIDRHLGDKTELKSITHNLVSIRFHLELDQNYLPRVICRLLEKLTNIFYVHHLFERFHDDSPNKKTTQMPDILTIRREAKAVYGRLSKSRNTVANSCQNVIIRCLDEYSKFAGQPDLFQRSAPETSDNIWKQDLTSLHQCLCLSSRYVAIENEFIGNVQSTSHDKHAVCEKLAHLFRHHLECVHAEAMTSMGRMLARETWMLSEFASDKRNESMPGNPQKTVESLLRDALEKECMSDTSWQNTSFNVPCEFILNYPIIGNPFSKAFEDVIAACSSKIETKCRNCRALSPSPVYLELVRVFATDSTLFFVAPTSTIFELTKWCSRLLTTIQMLPLLAADVSVVAENILDLFFTTVFRFCCGSAKNEKLLLAIVPPSDIHIPPADALPHIAAPVESPLFSPFRKTAMSYANSPPRRHTVNVSAQVEAEMTTPLRHELADVVKLQHFITRAHDRLQGFVNLDKVGSWLSYPPQCSQSIEEHACNLAQILLRRVSALWSCFIAAALADAFRCAAHDRILSSSCELATNSCLLPLVTYVTDALQVMPTLVSLGTRFSCLCAIGGNRVVTQILEVGTTWEGSSFKESANEYVEELSERCALLWGYLSISGKLPLPLLNPMWEQLLSAAYSSLLEGFARIPFCSTEGRALMTLDLASLSAGTATESVAATLEKSSLETQLPPLVDANRFMEHIGMYIKVYYFPVEEAMDWIKKNCTKYPLNHMLALIVATAGPGVDTRVLVNRVREFGLGSEAEQ